MIWFWPIITILLFYFFALLQSSFLIYFNLFGTVPNLIFILFFILVFFSEKDSYYRLFFCAIMAGTFLDIFSVSKFGISIILLTLIGLAVKKIQTLLKERDDNYPFAYFFSLFLGSLLAYNLLSQNISINFNQRFFTEIVYSSVIAILGFFIYKKFCGLKNKGKQKRFF